MSDKIREEEERARRSLKFKHSSVRTSKSPQSAQPQYLALKSAGVAPMKRRLVKSAPEAHLVARQGERGDQDADDESSLQLLGSWVIEGVTAVFALEHWLRSNAQAPCDLVLALWRPYKRLTNEQSNMLRYLKRHWLHVEPDLLERGVRAHSLLFGVSNTRKAS